jgi:hypothetical protein
VTSTPIGTIASRWQATVDPRGVVKPSGGTWALDWWIGGDDRWYVPAAEPPSRMRQGLVDATPVVETTMRVPGGEGVHRAYAVTASAPRGVADFAIVEIENRTKVPFAVAFALRDTGDGLVARERIDVADETTVRVDGRAALLLPRRASRMDQAAFIYPLAHGASIRVASPIGPPPRAARWPFSPRRRERAPMSPSVIAPAARVASGWKAQTRDGERFVLPDARLHAAVNANRGFLLMSEARVRVADAEPSWARIRDRLDRASATFTWDGDHLANAAAFVASVRALLVHDERHGIALCSVVPEEWRGQAIEAHDVVTTSGTMSFAVRWHGARPALLWELVGGAAPVRITAPGLDAAWSTTDASGEALLGAVAPRTTTGSFG